MDSRILRGRLSAFPNFPGVLFRADPVPKFCGVSNLRITSARPRAVESSSAPTAGSANGAGWCLTCAPAGLAGYGACGSGVRSSCPRAAAAATTATAVATRTLTTARKTARTRSERPQKYYVFVYALVWPHSSGSFACYATAVAVEAHLKCAYAL